ncbi:uncharacterized protein [Hemitrygon akajei]|uniref:uncharacterized protein n=1 Tax=Hemitrygon akajei TaxID=2704970 RepID=UPI003BF941EB
MAAPMPRTRWTGKMAATKMVAPIPHTHRCPTPLVPAVVLEPTRSHQATKRSDTPRQGSPVALERPARSAVATDTRAGLRLQGTDGGTACGGASTRHLRESTSAAASRESVKSPQPTGVLTTAAASRKSAQCYFCGLEKHPRKRCPAQEATCSSCGKKGHFAKACNSKPRAGSSCTACEAWGSPSCLATACGAWGAAIFVGSTSPRLRPTGAYRAPRRRFNSRLRDTRPTPHQLARSMMDILVEGHRTSCLFDTGSTERFIHPDTVQRCGLVTRPEVCHWDHPTGLADVPRASAALETCEEQ